MNSLTELSNTVRKLFKCMEKANISYYKSLLFEINCVIDTKYYCYQVKPDKKSMDHVNCDVIVTETTQEIIAIGKA